MKIIKNLFIPLLILCFGCRQKDQGLWVNYAPDSHSSIIVKNLRCEFLQNPLGIETLNPRLTWELSSGEKDKQIKSFQVFVSRDSLMLTQNKADLWDSGKISEGHKNQTIYNGSNLTSQSYAYWKVRVWDENGNISDWSPIGKWMVGLIEPDDWKAKWIGAIPENIPLDSRYYPHSGYHSAVEESPDVEKWVILDLSTREEIDEVWLYPAIKEPLDKDAYLFPDKFRIEISNDANFDTFTTVADETKNDYKIKGLSPYVKRFNPIQARYVRMLVTQLAERPKEKYAFALAEIEVRKDKKNKALEKSVITKDVYIHPPWESISINWQPERLVDGFLRPNFNHSNYSLNIPPSPLIRKGFNITKKVKRASLFITSLGLYEARINSRKVGDQILAPEWTDYHTRVNYQVYDVTNLLQEGENVMGAILADGWYANDVWSHPERGPYGFDRRLLAQLEIEYDDKLRETISSDQSWKIFEDGPIRQASLFDGEVYDARLDQIGWDSPGFDDSNWKAVNIDDSIDIILSAQLNEPIKVIDELMPVNVFKTKKKDTYIFDMGQNMVGWCRLTLPYNPGNQLTLRFAEVLTDDNTLYVENLRSAKQTDIYIPSVEERVLYEPRFTYHGFRFVEVSGLSRPPDLKTILGKVVASSSPSAGSFECSDTSLNQLWSNILWTQIGNMHSIPTDCPQRDERAGWMGDAQVFSQTAIFNLDMAAFFTKWIRDIRDSQLEDGRFPDFAPQVGTAGAFYNSPGWADAGVIVPWRMYENYGDTIVLGKQFMAMKKFIDFIQKHNPDLLWVNGIGNMYGDWLNGNTIISEDYPKDGGSVPNDVYSTAFFAYSTNILSKTAKVLNKIEDHNFYDSLATAIKHAFVREYIDNDGKIKGDTQAGYALALEFYLVPDRLKKKAVQHMVKAVEDYDYRISTGIQTTVRLMNQLSENGYNEVAYKLLESRRFPSWLYSIDQGATTIWERWDGYVKGRGFQNSGMNSFNHYAIGAVGEWMYRYILGINNDEKNPGYSHFIIRPILGGSLTWAKGSYHSIAGIISVYWEKDDDEFILEVEIPVNTNATVILPLGKGIIVSGTPIEKAPGIKFIQESDEGTKLMAQSGKYTFKVLL
ncbi:hypothetical protein BH23BAC2_BH23BAC2_03450 [soil metagenome]